MIGKMYCRKLLNQQILHARDVVRPPLTFAAAALCNCEPRPQMKRSSFGGVARNCVNTVIHFCGLVLQGRTSSMEPRVPDLDEGCLGV